MGSESEQCCSPRDAEYCEDHQHQLGVPSVLARNLSNLLNCGTCLKGWIDGNDTILIPKGYFHIYTRLAHCDAVDPTNLQFRNGVQAIGSVLAAYGDIYTGVAKRVKPVENVLNIIAPDLHGWQQDLDGLWF